MFRACLITLLCLLLVPASYSQLANNAQTKDGKILFDDGKIIAYSLELDGVIVTNWFDITGDTNFSLLTHLGTNYPGTVEFSGDGVQWDGSKFVFEGSSTNTILMGYHTTSEYTNTVEFSENFPSDDVIVLASMADATDQIAMISVLDTTRSNFSYTIRTTESITNTAWQIAWIAGLSNNVGGSGGGGSVYTAGTYPVFKLDIGLVDGNWTDFEIKASVDNFTNKVYYYKSWTTNQNASYGDTNTFVYFTDDHSTDVKFWHTKPETNAISEMLVDTNSVVQWVYFYPSHDCVVDWQTWMQKTNVNLIWSWVRVDDIGFELNASGTKQRWNPIRPESWEINRTVP